MIINTGSWYQILLKRRKVQIPTGYPPIKHFKVSSDILNYHILLSVENIYSANRAVLSVTNIDAYKKLVFSVENISKESKYVFNVKNTNPCIRIIFSAENID